MTTTGTNRRGVARMAALGTAIGIMAVGFAGLSATASDAKTLSTSHGVEPKGISELYGVSCPTVTTCVAAGTATGSTQSKLIPGVTRTVNGGASWSKGTLKGGPNDISDVACATKKKCVGVGSSGSNPAAFTPGVMVTSNGGASWTGQLLAGAGELYSLSCPSTSRCVAVGATISSSQISPLVVVSSDGGASWTPGTLPTGTGPMNDVSCPSTNFCLAVGTFLSTGGGTPASGIDAITSKDGGSTWTTSASPGTGALNAVSCANSRVCVAIGSSTLAPGGPTQILVTNNAGAAWSSAALPPAIGYLDNVTCPSSRRCIAVGYLGNPFLGKDVPPAAINSLDGGHSWSSEKLLGSKASGINAVACSTATRCVAVGSTSGLNGTAKTTYTTNGGKTWS
jgi:photosystem II stability/assembly factor-like uncharacterized protein